MAKVRDMLVPEGEDHTRGTFLEDFATFSRMYFFPIRRAFRLLTRDDQAANDLAESFLLKALEGNFLGTYHRATLSRPVPFRSYLYRSLSNHIVDSHRKDGPDGTRSRPVALDPDVADAIGAAPAAALDPDTFYALDILNQSLQALRRNCEKAGRGHIWKIFEEKLLADEFRGRVPKTRDELLAEYPGQVETFLADSLWTAKRAFRRIIHDLLPDDPRDGLDPDERFVEWMGILRGCHASQFELLHIAYRVIPYVGPETESATSMSMVVPGSPKPNAATYASPSAELTDDELGILISFRLEMPLTTMLDFGEIERFVPASSDLWPGTNPAVRSTRRQPLRPLCLLTLIDPTPEESAALDGCDLVGLLERIKEFAKQLLHFQDPGAPAVFAKFLYTVANSLALCRARARIHTIGADRLLGNIRWFLRRPWLDHQLKALFEAAMAALDSGRA
jgi:DNA-directed RNA polymerase specialized sigma24 family protein